MRKVSFTFSATFKHDQGRGESSLGEGKVQKRPEKTFAFFRPCQMFVFTSHSEAGKKYLERKEHFDTSVYEELKRTQCSREIEFSLFAPPLYFLSFFSLTIVAKISPP